MGIWFKSLKNAFNNGKTIHIDKTDVSVNDGCVGKGLTHREAMKKMQKEEDKHAPCGYFYDYNSQFNKGKK